MDGCMYRGMDVGCSPTKRYLCFSNENTLADFGKTWYVGSGRGAQVLRMWTVVTECTYLIPHFHICSDWLIQKRQISRVLYEVQ